MHAILWLLLLALWALASKSQGHAAGPLHPRHRSLNAPARRHANFQAILETFDSRVRAALAGATPSREVDGDGDDASGAPERRLVRRRRQKRKTKKQLREALKACQSSLEACAAEEPRFLFIQMAQHCTMRMEGNRTFFSTTDMDIDTYCESSLSAIMP